MGVLGFLAVEGGRFESDVGPEREHQRDAEAGAEYDARLEHVEREAVKAVVDQDADIESEQDPDFAQERESKHLRAQRDLEVGQDGDDRECDQRPRLPWQVDPEDAVHHLVGEERQRAEDPDRRRVIGEHRDVCGGAAGAVAESLVA